jgi:hypothetical protein
MLRWNPNVTLIVVLALVVALSAFGGIFHGGHHYNFTW